MKHFDNPDEQMKYEKNKFKARDNKRPEELDDGENTKLEDFGITI